MDGRDVLAGVGVKPEDVDGRLGNVPPLAIPEAAEATGRAGCWRSRIRAGGADACEAKVGRKAFTATARSPSFTNRDAWVG